jgi:hypothetical protein
MRFFLSILGVIIFVVVAIVLIANGGAKNVTTKPIDLTSYNYVGTSVVQTTTGTLVGDGQRQAIRITISQNQREIDILSGYYQNVTSSETFENNQPAYGAFLGALENAMFTGSRRTNEVNMFGVCPLGNTFQYELNSPTKTVFNNWSTSCNYTDGTFAGNGPLIRQLFSLQIPNYQSFTNSTSQTISNPTT